MKKLLKWLFGSQYKQPVVSKRFPFGDILTFNGKDYRYLFTSGDNDVFFDENTIKIYMLPSKYIEAD